RPGSARAWSLRTAPTWVRSGETAGSRIPPPRWRSPWYWCPRSRSARSSWTRPPAAAPGSPGRSCAASACPRPLSSLPHPPAFHDGVTVQPRPAGQPRPRFPGLESEGQPVGLLLGLLRQVPGTVGHHHVADSALGVTMADRGPADAPAHRGGVHALAVVDVELDVVGRHTNPSGHRHRPVGVSKAQARTRHEQSYEVCAYNPGTQEYRNRTQDRRKTEAIKTGQYCHAGTARVTTAETATEQQWKG